MFESKLNTATNQMQSLLDEAENVFHKASSATGDRAEKLQERGLRLLDASLSKARDVDNISRIAGARAVDTANALVHENPWRMIAISGVIAAGIGLAIGMSISRR